MPTITVTLGSEMRFRHWTSWKQRVMFCRVPSANTVPVKDCHMDGSDGFPVVECPLPASYVKPRRHQKAELDVLAFDWMLK